MKLRAEVHNQVSTREQPSIHSQEIIIKERDQEIINQITNSNPIEGLHFWIGSNRIQRIFNSWTRLISISDASFEQWLLDRSAMGLYTQFVIQVHHKETAPPLGTYEIKGLDRYGYYTNSRFKNACAALFSPPKPHHAQTMLSPGPGDYLLPGSMNDKGVYHVAGYKTKIGFAIGKNLQFIMNFDFLIFPAPKFTDKEHPQGQLLWVPKYQRLYPDFMGYIPRRNKKQQIFFVQQQLDSSDEDRIHEVEEIMQVRYSISEYNPQPVPKFNWKPIRNSGRDSPSMISSDDNSPEVLANKMTHLNSISVNQLISNIDAVSIMLDNSVKRNTRQSQIHNSISLSQPNIRLPDCLDQKQIRSPLQKQKSQRSAFEMLGHIPCMYVDSGCMSPNIILYFHGNAETVNQSYPFLLSLKNYFKVSCLAIEYPGYGLYTDSSPNADQILNDAEYVYSYIIKRLGYSQECVIIFGRSIGSGPATYLASKYTPACLTLMSPFTSLQAVVRDYIGGWASHLVKQRFDNLANIREVRSPTLILHGKIDELIPYKQAEELQRACGALCKLHLSEDMDHIQYKPNADLFQPMNTFLNQIHYFSNRSQGVKLPTNLFRVPHKD